MQKDQWKLGTNGWNPMVAQAPAASETASKLELPCPPHPNPAITLTDRGLFAYQSTSAEARELMVLASFNQFQSDSFRPGDPGALECPPSLPTQPQRRAPLTYCLSRPSKL